MHTSCGISPPEKQVVILVLGVQHHEMLGIHIQLYTPVFQLLVTHNTVQAPFVAGIIDKLYIFKDKTAVLKQQVLLADVIFGLKIVNTQISVF